MKRACKYSLLKYWKTHDFVSLRNKSDLLQSPDAKTFVLSFNRKKGLLIPWVVVKVFKMWPNVTGKIVGS